MKALEDIANNHISGTILITFSVTLATFPTAERKTTISFVELYSDPVSFRPEGKASIWGAIITRTWRGQLREGGGGGRFSD